MRKVTNIIVYLYFVHSFKIIGEANGRTKQKVIEGLNVWKNVPDHNKKYELKIINGVETSINVFPYQLAMLKNAVFVCGAAYIGKHFAVTVAHCLDDKPSIHRIQFRAGSNYTFKEGFILNVKEYHIHPMYDYFTASFDIAIVKLSYNNHVGDSLKAIPLPSLGMELSDGIIVLVSGWGLTETGLYPTKLHMTMLPIVSHTKCNNLWKNAIDETMLCAGEYGKDYCNKDSGSPLVYQNVLYGLASWGDAICGSHMPSIYCNVAESQIRNFILNKTGI